MEHQYFKEHSKHLGKDMEFNVYGFAGRPLLMFPTMDGRFYQYGDFGLIDSITDYINSGKIQVFCVDGIDFESITNHHISFEDRIGRYEQFISYVTKELIPRVSEINGGKDLPLIAGCSMGGYHTTNLFFRFPELFIGMISLSGVFSLQDLFPDYEDGFLFKNSPLEYLASMKTDDKKYPLYLRSRIVMCCGQGEHEDQMMRDIIPMQEILASKKIPAFIDIWGHDVNHDWDWWKKQLPYFLDKVLASL